MATSDVEVCNLALQKVGGSRIASLDESSTNAEECNAAYVQVRQTELRKHNWNFAKKRAQLAAHATAPDFDFDYAYPLPSDYLKLLPPSVNELDWRIENHEGQLCILTNWTAPLEIVYIADITDPTRFDASFTEMFACKLAMQVCYKVTGSNSREGAVAEQYKEARAEARRNNAFENVSDEPPEDPWLAARR